MKITAKNTAVGQTREDVISKGGVLALPTEARIHAIVSNSAEDDFNGILQVETATANGTIAGVLQIETATIAGAIGVSGAGDARVTITGALVTGSPLTVLVAVANNDDASAVAGKIRTALAIAAITDHYTVSGATDKVILTTKAVAANDATLNIAFTNGTCTGLTPNATSANTLAGHAGTGNASVVVTSAILAGSPVTVSVPVVVGDIASAWAAKVRTALNNTAAITAKYTVSGATDKVILTAKENAANDSSLNIALADGTCNGIVTAGTSANTIAGVYGTGASHVRISGITTGYVFGTESVAMNGVTPVNTKKAYYCITGMEVIDAKTNAANVGLITATAATDSTISCEIEVGENISQQAVYMVPALKPLNVKYFNASVYNATGGAVTTLDVLVKKYGSVWMPLFSIVLDADHPTFTDVNSGFFPELDAKTIFKVAAAASAGSSIVNVNFDIE